MERVQLLSKPRAGGLYFKSTSKENATLRFIDSGCTLLNCLTTGGRRGAWPLGRVVNIIGDKSVGKTLEAIEACANFAIQYPKGFIFYRESEAAFDLPYAGAIGLPIKRVDFGPQGTDTKWDTIEDIFEDLIKCIAKCKEAGVPGLYIVDSLDALGSRLDKVQAAKATKLNKDTGSYRLGKQRTLSAMFSDLTRDLKEAQICVIFISQVRENIGVTFGKKYRRTGGKSLDFYSSIILWLSHIETEYKTIKKIKRAVGVRIRVKCTKNKIAAAFGECEFTIRFGYGVDDVNANLDWLYHVGRMSYLEMDDKTIKELEDLPDEEYRAKAKIIQDVVYEAWEEVEGVFQPKRKKYG